MSTKVVVEISPDTTTRPVLTSVSQATRPLTSSRSTASRTESEIWSAILSGWPSVTDSEVKRYSRAAMAAKRLVDLQEGGERAGAAVAVRPGEERPERLEVLADLGGNRLARRGGQAEHHRDAVLEVEPHEPDALGRHSCGVARVLKPFVVGELVAVAAQFRDRPLPDRDDDLLVERSRAQLDLTEVDALDLDAGLLRWRMARLCRDALRQVLDRSVDALERRLLVRSLEHERDLRDRRAGPHIEPDLVLEQLQQRAQRDPEHPLELAHAHPVGVVLLELAK